MFCSSTLCNFSWFSRPKICLCLYEHVLVLCQGFVWWGRGVIIWRIKEQGGGQPVTPLLGLCQQPKGFNGTVFWELSASDMFSQRMAVGARDSGPLDQAFERRRRAIRPARPLIVSSLRASLKPGWLRYFLLFIFI